MRLLTILFDIAPLLWYTLTMKRGKKQRIHKGAEEAQRGAAAMANATKGRARTFKDRKKDANRKACRGKVDHE